MGCDGGTIPRRDELVRVKKKPEQKDKDAEREFRWLHCALTQQRLEEPIVICGLGRLYSKQNIIEQLLEKGKTPDTIKHIRSMKDIKQLKLTPNPAFKEAEKTDGALNGRHAPYICKLIGLEMSGKFRFIALWSCGCVMSERAIKEIKGFSKNSGGMCPLCQQPFSIEDMIVLNPLDEDLETMQLKIEMRNAKRKSNKKLKKDGPLKIESLIEKREEKSEKEEDKQSTDEPSTSKVLVPDTKVNANVTKLKVLANSKRLGSNSHALEDPELKRLKTEYSVAKDPKATDVYKSLFTTHSSAKDQERAHWVTYNPFYN
uniref:Replication termination factor 2 n=1 Tax=Glossina brevipalpis TaxID=37001 RepID=A0A1A9WZX0_9MUSC